MINTRLPTLTRTPLPTLTPTSVSVLVTVAQKVESVEVAPAAISTTAVAEAADASAAVASDVAAEVEAVAGTSELEQTSAPLETSAEEDSARNEPPAASAAETSFVQLQAVVTHTPASLPTATATQSPIPTIPPTATPTGPPTETPTPTPLPQDWVFSGVQLHQTEARVLLHGNVTNNSGVGQKILTINATVYDARGQLLTLADAPDPHWPGYVVLPGDTIPFKLELDATGVTTFDLMVEAKPSDNTPRRDFEFSDLEERNDGEDYCISGTLGNPGAEVREYLIIAAILYDHQERVVNFGDYGIFGYVGLLSGDSVPFDLCVQPPNQRVARYEVRAWGL